jgi:hypothetical protein
MRYGLVRPGALGLGSVAGEAATPRRSASVWAPASRETRRDATRATLVSGGGGGGGREPKGDAREHPGREGGRARRVRRARPVPGRVRACSDGARLLAGFGGKRTESVSRGRLRACPARVAVAACLPKAGAEDNDVDVVVPLLRTTQKLCVVAALASCLVKFAKLPNFSSRSL